MVEHAVVGGAGTAAALLAEFAAAAAAAPAACFRPTAAAHAAPPCRQKPHHRDRLSWRLHKHKNSKLVRMAACSRQYSPVVAAAWRPAPLPSCRRDGAAARARLPASSHAEHPPPVSCASRMEYALTPLLPVPPSLSGCLISLRLQHARSTPLSLLGLMRAASAHPQPLPGRS